jgi:oxygen-independent coproporphyrinogen-3 oxidase
LGPAAHSYRHPVRQWNVADLKRYAAGMACGEPDIEKEVLTPAQQYDEFVLLRLRTREGIPLQELEKKFGAERKAQFLRQLQQVNSAHYVADTETVRLTEAGLLFADAVAEELFA